MELTSNRGRTATTQKEGLTNRVSENTDKARVAFHIARMNDLGKLLFIIGLVLVILGAVIWKTGGLGGLGRRQKG